MTTYIGAFILDPDGAKLEAMIDLKAPRILRDVYRRMSAASRAQPRRPGLWSRLTTNLLGPRE